MISLILSFIVLIIGYLTYSKLVDKMFAPDNRKTPAIAINDGVDCVPIKKWKAFLIQLLNIAGTGPIFGAIMGAVFGPVVFLWIVFGSILGGAVHDYMVGMISCRHEGKSIAELSGIYINDKFKWIMRIFSIVLLVLTGTVFVTSPAALIANLTPANLTYEFWIMVILLYYILATLIPIDKLIGKLYPLFGVILIVMAALIGGGIIINGAYHIPEIDFMNLNMHAEGLPVFPFMFITVACGAISGFHATQSPMIAKCIESEKEGRETFYGAMIGEAIIALVWAAAGVAFYGSSELLNNAISTLGQSGVVYEISKTLLGSVGGILAIVGVVICPITSGDTAFRSARLIISETFNLNQKKLKNRLVITIPLLIAGLILSHMDFNSLWRYFSWSNQTLAMISLWVATIYLFKNCSYKLGSLITAIPATFMSAVSVTYILTAEEGFSLDYNIAVMGGIIFAIVLFIVYLCLFFQKIIVAFPSFPERVNDDSHAVTIMKIRNNNIIELRDKTIDLLRSNEISEIVVNRISLAIEEYLYLIKDKNGQKNVYVQCELERVNDKEIKLYIRDNGKEFSLDNLEETDMPSNEFMINKMIEHKSFVGKTHNSVKYNENIFSFSLK